ncbi:hypothetical protein JTE90_018548 [Oedothorax gibbosus]|uniref:Uncharacterized protein n=1 Tax=Oedothorax gibbosus TaxID=931172 RepID=A0AAV6V6Q9_9ARAC|nr:hypothetical protein JTE90_018548 [Oedothorax gibbosus]
MRRGAKSFLQDPPPSLPMSRKGERVLERKERHLAATNGDPNHQKCKKYAARTLNITKPNDNGKSSPYNLHRHPGCDETQINNNGSRNNNIKKNWSGHPVESDTARNGTPRRLNRAEGGPRYDGTNNQMETDGFPLGRSEEAGFRMAQVAALIGDSVIRSGSNCSGNESWGQLE